MVGVPVGGWGWGGGGNKSEPASVRHTQPLSQSESETIDGWENTRREVLTRRLSYHGIRSGLWETAPPKHTRTLSLARTHTHTNTGRRTSSTLAHNESPRET